MENYIVSARKYRPVTFDQVVGQQSLTTTLKNAIASGKLAHAYLFCGPRGVGKTTCARIFAKTINCLNPLPNGEACNECESCKAFNEQRSYNIHELDAASNNSVDDIRSLIEEVRIPPQIGKYKVFIIDEVHMLSTQAFNAFLKTLEEPPAHAIFILATTEKHKILPTILSRCQIYDFSRMNVNDIVTHLEHVADKEGIKYEPDALNVIAQKADGAMRDALSIFDQVVSFTEGNVTYQKVLSNLNVLDSDYYFRLTDFFLANKAADVMLTFNEILNKGFEGGNFITGMAGHFRNLLVSKDAATLPLLEVSDQVRAKYQTQAAKCTTKFLYRAMKLCNSCELNYRASNNKRLLVELTLIEVAQLTEGDDDAGSGLRPIKKLKPLFKQVIAKPQPNVQGHVATTDANAAPAQSVASTTPHTENGSPTKPEITVSSNGERKIPVIKKNAFNISLRDMAGTPTEVKPKNEPTPQTVAPVKTPVPQENFSITERDVVYYWNEFANLLPKEKSAIMSRMQIIKPKQIKDNAYEILVDNQIVGNYMKDIMPDIVKHIRTCLHNSDLTISIRIDEQDEAKRAYSNREMLKHMNDKNESFARLIKELNLNLE
jgi:DNA polymerase-3 subunit gamma/tau